jgi:cytochrome c
MTDRTDICKSLAGLARCCALGCLLAAGIVPLAAPASEAGAPAAGAATDSARAQALLQKAVAHYQKRKDLAFADFNQQRAFVDGELYVYVVSSVTGVLLASGGPSFALVNQNVAELEDATGKAFFREMLAKAREKGSGTVEYLWLNRVDNKEEHKVAYFQKVDDRILAVGYYRR